MNTTVVFLVWPVYNTQYIDCYRMHLHTIPRQNNTRWRHLWPIDRQSIQCNCFENYFKNRCRTENGWKNVLHKNAIRQTLNFVNITTKVREHRTPSENCVVRTSWPIVLGDGITL